MKNKKIMRIAEYPVLGFQRKSHSMATPTKSFRIPDELMDQVKDRAKKSGISDAQFVREALLEKLEGNKQEHILREIQQLYQAVLDNRAETALATKCVLQNMSEGAKPLPRDVADEWVDTKLNQRRH